MKCIKCNKSGAMYLHRERFFEKVTSKTRERSKLLDTIAKCKKCGYEGEM